MTDSSDERDARLTAGADDLADARGSVLRNPRFLLWVSVTLITAGLALILLGWAGASRSIVVEEQVPYLISGGVLGLALTLLGAITLFGQWLTVLIRESREREVVRRHDHSELLDAVRGLTDAIGGRGGENGRARGPRAERAVRRTTRG